MLFDPHPITLDPATELPPVVVTIYATGEPYATVVKGYQDRTVWKVRRLGTTTIDGLPARVFDVAATGNGYLSAGTLVYGYVIDRGKKGALVMDTMASTAKQYAANIKIIDLMAGSIAID